MTSEAPAHGRSIGTRMVLGQGIVLVACLLTAALVAAVVGPGLFHQHMIEAGHSPNSPEIAHIEAAYTSANVVSLGVALGVALLGAAVVTWYLTRRLTAPLTELTRAAGRLSHGDYTIRVPSAGAGPELDTLGATFNDMAARLQTTEDTRRRMLSDLAHEMRTPLSTIGAYLDGLEDGVAVWETQAARVLRDQTDRLVRLAEDITDVSRAEERQLDLRPAPSSLNDLAWAATQIARTAYTAKGVNLVIDTGRTDGVEVSADRQRIGQVLANLLTNALRHTPAGGTVTVATGRDADRAGLITVADNGEGIAADQLPHIFERFYRGDAARNRDASGSGIGLTIARAIAIAHHGSLTASSEGADQGTQMTLTLPTSTHAAR